MKVDESTVKTQREKGKLTAAERIEFLMDKDSFVEINSHVELQSRHYDIHTKRKPRDGVITGHGKVGGRPVYVYAQDFTFMGGSMGEMHNKKISTIMRAALKNGCPCIGLLDSGGARIQEGVKALDAGGEIFRLNTFMSGVVPQLSIILGPCAGIAVYSPALTDFTSMTSGTSSMFITGPEVVKAATGQNVSVDELGGASIHGEKSGVAHFVGENDKECMEWTKAILSYLPSNNLSPSPHVQMNDSPTRLVKGLDSIIPTDPKKSYNVKKVLQEVLDKKSFLEVHSEFAKNVVIGFARLNNVAVGIVANQPSVLAGCLDKDASDKIARFVRCCDAFHIPLVLFVDVTGYLPGTEQEEQGIIRHGAKILYAFAESTTPKISVVTRKAYGGSYIALASKSMGFDHILAWPTAEIAIMGAEQAVNIIHRKDLKGKQGAQVKIERIKEYSEKFLNPNEAASYALVDMIIPPEETRKALISCLEMSIHKREAMGGKERRYKKHGNMPV